MSSQPEPARAPTEVRRLGRPDTGRVLVGVCVGVAEHLHVPVRAVRWVFVALIFVGGAGIAAYLLLWVLTRSADGAPLGADVEGAQQRAAGIRPAVRLLLAGAGMVVLGAAFVVAPSGIGINMATFVPPMAIGVGVVLAWTNLDEAERRAWLGTGNADNRRGLIRIGLGLVLALGGSLVIVTRQSLSQLWDVTVATVAVLGGLAIVLAPWGVRLWNRLQEEQSTRIREKERADIAAHLHDSVLQTLALIQRTTDPARVTQLARAQERQLRTWLYGGVQASQETLAAAVTAAAHEVEDLHAVPIDVVVTGNRPLDPSGQALVAAMREAMANAVRHGLPPVSAYVEVGRQRVEAFVRDHGVGFEVADVPEDRLGVRESILGRMTRHGGSAVVRRLERGTEVRLDLPVSEPANAPGDEQTSQSIDAQEEAHG